MLNADCTTLNSIEDHLYGIEEMSFKDEASSTFAQQEFDEDNMTLYMRFKRCVDKDDDGKPVHVSYLISKFKQEFDSQM